MQFSKFGQKLTGKSGILDLMDDLGNALSTPGKKYMFGGGNPAVIPAVQQVFRTQMEAMLAEDGKFESTIGNYDTPQGNPAFISAIVKQLNDQYGWNLTKDNVAISNGSQSGFFMLFNLLAGDQADGTTGKILFPLTPEYIGYVDQGISDNMFTSMRPTITEIDEHTHKYGIDFDNLKITDDIRAIAVSRPTNPTGNVITDAEVERLAAIAKENNIPLIIDNAYGSPFPDVIFSDTKMHWDDSIVLSMSLSKIGLPSLRTGIFIATPEIISAISGMNAIISLSSTSMGQALVAPMISDGSLTKLTTEVIRPHYRQAATFAREQLAEQLDGLPYSLHVHEGAFFFWLWLRDLPITTIELYERLKNVGVVVVPGEHFFPGLEDADSWDHSKQCLRINFGRPKAEIKTGFKLMAEVIHKAYSKS